MWEKSKTARISHYSLKSKLFRWSAAWWRTHELREEEPSPLQPSLKGAIFNLDQEDIFGKHFNFFMLSTVLPKNLANICMHDKQIKWFFWYFNNHLKLCLGTRTTRSSSHPLSKCPASDKILGNFAQKMLRLHSLHKVQLSRLPQLCWKTDKNVT